MTDDEYQAQLIMIRAEGQELNRLYRKGEIDTNAFIDAIHELVERLRSLGVVESATIANVLKS